MHFFICRCFVFTYATLLVLAGYTVLGLRAIQVFITNAIPINLAYTNTHIHTYTYLHTQTHKQTDTHTHTYTHIHTHTHTHTYTHTHTTHTHTQAHARSSTCSNHFFKLYVTQTHGMRNQLPSSTLLHSTLSSIVSNNTICLHISLEIRNKCSMYHHVYFHTLSNLFYNFHILSMTFYQYYL